MVDRRVYRESEFDSHTAIGQMNRDIEHGIYSESDIISIQTDNITTADEVIIVYFEK